MLVDALGKFHAALRGEFLGVVQAHDPASRIENYRSSDDGSKQRAAPGFIEPRDAAPAELSRRSLETGRAESRHDRRRCAGILPRRGPYDTQSLSSVILFGAPTSGHRDSHRYFRHK